MPLFCPYCLTQQAFTYPKCEKCQNDVPRDYIRNVRQYPPVWLATFGFPGHGKTNAINSMLMHIEKVDRIATSSFYDYLDPVTDRRIGEIRLAAREGKVDVPPTEQTATMPDPLLIELTGFPEERTNTLVIYDLAGQAAVIPNEEYVRAIKNCKTAWFIVSLADLNRTASRNDDQPRTITGLFMKYRQAIEELNVSLKGRTILVNYSKGDLLLEELPDKVRDYLMDDPYYNLVNSQVLPEHFLEEEYRRKLEEISQALREFTRERVPGGGAFLTQAERKYGLNVEFCVSSATGGLGRQTDIIRYRVLDPLLWAIYLNDKVLDQSINAALIIDQGAYENDRPIRIFNQMSNFGMNVASYHVGERLPVFDSGQPPSQRPTSAYIPLIGPILDGLDSSNQRGQNLALLLLTEETPLDLYDFFQTHWDQDLHIITTDPNIAMDWPKRTFIGPHDTGFAIEELIERITEARRT
ncbi:MAG: hypothetical protein M9928_11035 [Anaerolineae bacterium]|nr:hypothetical protein [Anaerolineae bacterium]MCO5205559.1 hypothetical protein [Anaerolineae bacterium]